jgi:hypothetical protein
MGRVEDWVEKNVKEPKSNCFFYSSVLSLLFPSVKLYKGKPEKSYDTAHFYVTEHGKVIDPTGSKGKKEPGDKLISAEKNLEEIVGDPLFRSLPDKDQQKIRSKMSKAAHLNMLMTKFASIVMPHKPDIGVINRMKTAIDEFLKAEGIPDADYAACAGTAMYLHGLANRVNIEGVWAMDIPSILKFKEVMGRPKDLAHAELIKKYMGQ